MSNILKGPWTLCYDGVIDDAEGGTVICFPFDSYREFNQQSDFDKAKQRAIAAAPELLSSLTAMVEAWNMVCDTQGWERDHIQQQKDAVKVIAKATGEKP